MNVEILHEDCLGDVKEVVSEKKHTKFQGIVASWSTMPEQPLNKFFATLAFSPKEAITLNKGIKRKYGDYTVREQLVIISRYAYFLDTISDEYQIHFEMTRDQHLHMHCIVETRENMKDLRIKSKRFFSIKAENRGFIDVRPITDLEGLLDYLTNKTEKKYQTSGIPPIIKTKTI